VRRWSIVGAVALVLAFSTSAVSPAFAQTPVTTTTVAGSPDDPSKDGAKATEEQPKPEKPKGEEPAADASVEPSADAVEPKPEEPKATEPKPTADEAKAEKPKAAAPTPAKPEKPKPAEPQPEAVKPSSAGKQPKPDKPKPTADEPVAPLHVAAAQASVPAAQAALAVSPTGQAAHAVAGSHARHVGSTRAERTTAPPDRAGAAGAAHSDPAPIGTAGDPVGATRATGRSADRAVTHAARLVPDDAASAAAPSESGPIRVLPLDAGPSGYDLTLLLTIVFTAGVAYLIGRETRRLPRAGARR
jgi:outer membrane biosynthesis protein TonB